MVFFVVVDGALSVTVLQVLTHFRYLVTSYLVI